MPESSITSQLEKCFSAVFPDLPPEQLRSASVDQVAHWDSMATVTLVALINEQFGCDLDLDQMEPLLSFEAIRQYLETARG